MLEQHPADKDAAGGDEEERPADDRQDEWRDETPNVFRGGNAEADNAAEYHKHEARDYEDRAGNDPEDAESAQVVFETTRRCWGYGRNNRAPTSGTDTELG